MSDPFEHYAARQNLLKLFEALSRRDLPIVKLALALGANPNGLDREGRRAPLALAIERGDDEALIALLGAGADPALPSPLGGLPMVQAARLGRAQALDILLRAGADLHARDPADGMTPAWAAGMHGHPDCLLFLAQAGARLNEPDGQGRLLAQEARGRAQAIALAWTESSLLEEAPQPPHARGGALRM